MALVVFGSVLAGAAPAGADVASGEGRAACSVERIRDGQFVVRVDGGDGLAVSVRRQPGRVGPLYTRIKLGMVDGVRSVIDGPLPEPLESVRYVLDLRGPTGRLVERVECGVEPVSSPRCDVSIGPDGTLSGSYELGRHGSGIRGVFERQLIGAPRFDSRDTTIPRGPIGNGVVATAEVPAVYSLSVDRRFTTLDRVICDLTIESTPTCRVRVDSDAGVFEIEVDDGGVVNPEFRVRRSVSENGPRWFRGRADGDGRFQDPFPTHVGIDDVVHDVVVRSIRPGLVERVHHISTITCSVS